ncbi:MAG TPA: ATP-binding protein, partial [Brevundimonas sp.]|uniref:sensor histidine kinase n=1 Tax=Brevundimonas sp. TaxID=1871086 RepID=UPI002EDA9701
PVDLEALVRGVAELLSPRAHDKGREIVWSVGAEAIDIIGDEGRLRQVLFNLAGNAVKFTEEGGVRITVERVGGAAGRPKLAFIIDDTGPGVPAAARQRIFEEFGHVDASDASRFGGAGLGLAVVSKLAAAMKGTVTVGDRPDGPGARFRFEAAFPAVKGADRGRPLAGHKVHVVSPDPFVEAAAVAQVEASGGRCSADAEGV